MSEEFERPYGNYILEKGLLHVNSVLKRFLVEIKPSQMEV